MITETRHRLQSNDMEQVSKVLDFITILLLVVFILSSKTFCNVFV